MSGDAREPIQNVIDTLSESRDEITTLINELRIRRDYGEPTDYLSDFKDLADKLWKTIQEHGATGV